MPTPSYRRCLIVERHVWETGGASQQLQFLLEHAEQFFGPGVHSLPIVLRVFLAPFLPAYTANATISRTYGNGTRRLNGFPQMGTFAAGFIFFQETADQNVYDLWYQADSAIVAASYRNWLQGHNTQYGRGRLSNIVRAPVPRPLDTLL
jgi:hypothetical protein